MYIINIVKEKFKNRRDIEHGVLLKKMSRLNAISELHKKTFSEYKGIYSGKDVVMIGAGPTVSKFRPIPNCIYVGLNRACLLKNVKFDYLFSIDKLGIDNYYKEFGEYDCVKFVGDQNNGANYQIPESEILKMKNVKRYKTDMGLCFPPQCTLDIESEPLCNFNSVSLQAMQFILYTNPRRIYIVGIDCTNLGHFDSNGNDNETNRKRLASRGEDVDDWARKTIEAWTKLKEFAHIYYPDTEIVSVNPIGLKGFFKDLYQE